MSTRFHVEVIESWRRIPRCYTVLATIEEPEGDPVDRFCGHLHREQHTAEFCANTLKRQLERGYVVRHGVAMKG